MEFRKVALTPIKQLLRIRTCRTRRLRSKEAMIFDHRVMANVIATQSVTLLPILTNG
jgi:hypothetical protein